MVQPGLMYPKYLNHHGDEGEEKRLLTVTTWMIIYWVCTKMCFVFSKIACSLNMQRTPCRCISIAGTEEREKKSIFDIDSSVASVESHWRVHAQAAKC